MTSPRQTALPAPGGLHLQSFSDMICLVALAAGSTHVLFLGLFWWMQVWPMVIFNIGSVLLYLASYRLGKAGRSRPAWYLAMGEVILHAVLAVTMVGWASGFHFYLLLVIPVAVISTLSPRPKKVAVVTGLTALYLMADVLMLVSSPRYQLDDVHLTLLHYINITGAISILIFMAAIYHRQIMQAETVLHDLATTDPLTQLYNRRAMHQVLQRMGQPQRGELQLAIVLADIDHFKRINDQYGHDGGDEVLRQVSRRLQSHLRREDCLARWGGEEFMLALPVANEGEALAAAERLRQAIATQPLAMPSALTVTMTLGVSLLAPGESSDAAITRADHALYEGKRQGRNCVQLAGTTPRQELPVPAAMQRRSDYRTD